MRMLSSRSLTSCNGTVLQWDGPTRTCGNHYNTLMKSPLHPLVREIINYRTDVRTITAGLRRRRLNLQPMPGVGRGLQNTSRNTWSHPDFNLARQHPWIPRVVETLNDGDTLAAERELLRATWNMWRRFAARTHFTFERVVLYLVQWEIVDRWTRLNEANGRERFVSLLQQSLEYTDGNDV